MMKIGKKMMVIFCTALMLASCGGKGKNTGAQTLYLMTESPSNTLHSVENPEAINSEVIINFQEGLVGKNLSEEIVPGMAETWEVSDDGTEYTFHLRDAEWSNGTPVTADDFVFAFELMSTLPGAAYKDYMTKVVNGTEILAEEKDVSELGVTAVDDKTLEVKLATPVSYFTEMLATPTMAPINRAFYEEVGADSYGTSKETVLSNGPFELTTYEPSEGYTLSKNEKYWDAANVNLGAVEVRVVPLPETQSLLFDSGDSDRLYLTGDLSEKYDEVADNIQAQKDPRTQWMYLSGTTKSENTLLANKNFRKAFAHSFDKQVIAEKILRNGSVPTDGLIPRDFVFIDGVDYREASKQYQTLSYDPAVTKEYYEKAKAEMPNESFEFTLNILDEEAEKSVYEYIKSEAEKNMPGVVVNLEPTPRGTYYTNLFEHKTPAATCGWGADLSDPSTFFELFTTTNSINFAQYSNENYDNLIAKTSTSEQMIDPMARWETMFEAEKVLLDDYNYIPLYNKGQKVIYKENVSGLLKDNNSKNTQYKYVTK